MRSGFRDTSRAQRSPLSPVRDIKAGGLTQRSHDAGELDKVVSDRTLSVTRESTGHEITSGTRASPADSLQPFSTRVQGSVARLSQNDAFSAEPLLLFFALGSIVCIGCYVSRSAFLFFSRVTSYRQTTHPGTVTILGLSCSTQATREEY